MFDMESVTSAQQARSLLRSYISGESSMRDLFIHLEAVADYLDDSEYSEFVDFLENEFAPEFCEHAISRHSIREVYRIADSTDIESSQVISMRRFFANFLSTWPGTPFFLEAMEPSEIYPIRIMISTLFINLYESTEFSDPIHSSRFSKDLRDALLVVSNRIPEKFWTDSVFSAFKKEALDDSLESCINIARAYHMLANHLDQIGTPGHRIFGNPIAFMFEET